MIRIPVLLMLSALIIFSSCNKAKSDKWIVAKVHVYDNVTGAPIHEDVTVRLEWAIGTGGSWTDPTVVSEVVPNAEGYAEFESKISENSKYQNGFFRIAVRSNLNYDKWGYMFFTEQVNAEGENNIEVPISPNYLFSLSARNVTCTAPTDSVWITFAPNNLCFANNFEAYGCADTSYNTDWLPQIYSLDEITFQITTKKSGVTNSYDETYSLPFGTFGNETPIVIEY